MALLHVKQIEAALRAAFADKIDLSDLPSASNEARDMAFLSRAQAAFVLTRSSAITIDEAAEGITDGGQDNGLDAIYCGESDKVLCLVQSKWRSTGSGTIDRGETQKYLKGVRDLISARWDKFNNKVKCKSPNIQRLLDDSQTRIRLCITHTGQEGLSKDVQDDLSDFLSEQNDPVEIFSLEIYGQGELHRAVSLGVADDPINGEVTLYDWGMVREPYFSVYGQVAASDVALLFQAFGSRLFTPNIRSFLGSTHVNEAIEQTLLVEPA